MNLTVVVPVSPIPSHPDISILSETVESVRHWLPDSEILMTFDGVRGEQADRYDDYEEAIRRALWVADKKWGAVCPFVFEEHLHQSGMLKRVIGEIRTPLLMYVESDTPLVTDEPIDWDGICRFVLDGHSNLVRLSHEATLLDDHAHMHHGPDGAGQYQKTSQWSQRPHIASTAYYRRLLEAHFSEKSRCYLEDRLHGVVDNAFRTDGMNGWLQHRLHMWTPNDTNIKRSYHLDARAGEPKFDDQQVW